MQYVCYTDDMRLALIMFSAVALAICVFSIKTTHK